MKQLIIPFIVFLISLFSVNALTQSVVWGGDVYENNTYWVNTTGFLKFNATVTVTDPTNSTNATIWFIGSNNTAFGFTNSTINGSRTSVTSHSFRINVSMASLPEGVYTVIMEVRNDTLTTTPSSAVNSSPLRFVVDRTIPQILIDEPFRSSTVVPSGSGAVTFKYTPSDTHLGNCSLNLNNQLVKSSTSGTTSSNMTSGSQNSFTHAFSADNDSVRVAINCKDLAGRLSGSDTRNNFTFNVLIGSVPYAVKQAQASGGGYLQPQQKGFAVASSGVQIAQASTHLQRYAWLYLIVFVVVVIVVFKKLK